MLLESSVIVVEALVITRGSATREITSARNVVKWGM
jgi:hypothetical protein